MNIKIAETDKELEQAYNVRINVFVDEQKVPTEEELDAYDTEAIHFIGTEDGQVIAASRLRFVDTFGKLERICIEKAYRGKAYGKQLIEFMEEAIKKRGYPQAKLNAQTHAEGFYQKLGYETISGEFMDAGIPHVTMVKDLS